MHNGIYFDLFGAFLTFFDRSGAFFDRSGGFFTAAIPHAATPPAHAAFPARWTFCTRSRKFCSNRPGPGRHPERSRTRSDRLSNPAAADCSGFPGRWRVFSASQTQPTRVLSRILHHRRTFSCVPRPVHVWTIKSLHKKTSEISPVCVHV